METLSRVAYDNKTTLTPTNTGFVEKGNDFGSSYVPMITDTKIAMLSGEPTNTLEFGEIWHFFEQQLHYPLTILDSEYYDQVELSNYDVLILPNGWYGKFFSENKLQDLKEFVKNGGKVIAMEGAIKGINGEHGFGLKEKEIKKIVQKTYSHMKRRNAKTLKMQLPEPSLEPRLTKHTHWPTVTATTILPSN